jgi:hypothetical protein
MTSHGRSEELVGSIRDRLFRQMAEGARSEVTLVYSWRVGGDAHLCLLLAHHLFQERDRVRRVLLQLSQVRKPAIGRIVYVFVGARCVQYLTQVALFPLVEVE